MTRLTLVESQAGGKHRFSALRDLKVHILFMIESYQRARNELALSLAPDIPARKTPLVESDAGRTWRNQEQAS